VQRINVADTVEPLYTGHFGTQKFWSIFEEVKNVLTRSKV